jgi:hypothetical protein
MEYRNIIARKNSSVGIATVNWFTSRGSIPGRSKMFHFPILSKLALALTQPPFLWILGSFLRRVTRPSSIDVKDDGSIAPLHHVFMA